MGFRYREGLETLFFKPSVNFYGVTRNYSMFLKFEDNLNFLKMEENLIFLKMEDDLNFCENGSWSQLYRKWKTT